MCVRDVHFLLLPVFIAYHAHIVCNVYIIHSIHIVFLPFIQCIHSCQLMHDNVYNVYIAYIVYNVFDAQTANFNPLTKELQSRGHASKFRQADSKLRSAPFSGSRHQGNPECLLLCFVCCALLGVLCFAVFCSPCFAVLGWLCFAVLPLLRFAYCALVCFALLASLLCSALGYIQHMSPRKKVQSPKVTRSHESNCILQRRLGANPILHSNSEPISYYDCCCDFC